MKRYESVQIGDCTLYLGLPVMMFGVVGPRHHLKVFNPVVGLVAVDVVDDLIVSERSPQVHLHDDAVLPLASVGTVALRREGDVSVSVVGEATAKMAMGRPDFAHSLALKAAAAFCDALPQRPALNGPFFPAVAATPPVMKFVRSLLNVRNDNEAPEPEPGEIGQFVAAPVTAVSG